MTESTGNRSFTTWIELDRQAFFNNYTFFRKKIRKKTRICAVIKANAYGHGIREMAGLCLEAGVDCLAVHSLDEGHTLRSLSSSVEILILGPVPQSRVDEAVAGRFKITVYEIDLLRAISRVCREKGATCEVHLKMETGTHRQGIAPGDLSTFLDWLREHPEIELQSQEDP